MKVTGFSDLRQAPLDTLTSFRFIAALLVFLHHVGIGLPYRFGYMGVSFFFLLSGFILTYKYSGSFHTLEARRLVAFYTARIAKIYPIHILTFLAAVPYYFFIPLSHEPVLYVFQAATNLLLIHSFIPFGNISFNGVSWSLSDELFFYMLFPPALYAVLRRASSRLKLGLAVTLAWLLLASVFSFLPSGSEQVVWLAYYFPLTRFLEFFAGIVLALLYLEHRQRLERLPRGYFTSMEVLAILLLAGAVLGSPHMPPNLRYGLLYLPFWCLIIMVFAFQRGLLSGLARNRLLVYFGQTSFSFYMIHNLILSYVYYLWKPDIHRALLIMGCLGLAMILSSLLYHWYEEPMRKKVIRYAAKKRERGSGRQAANSAA